ncbi:MAG: VanZ family protein [Endomicrobiales bacterium]|nr:VanZ family protein [Endomicrobiales bacterium]
MLKKSIINWLPVAVWCTVIFYFSNMPNYVSGTNIYDFLLRKTAHVTEYFVLFLLFRRALAGSFEEMIPKRVIFFSFVFSFLYACSDEYHQSFIFGRGPSVVDVGIDTAGVMLGIWVYNKRKTFKGLLKAAAMLFLAVCTFGLTGCGPSYDFSKGKSLEKKGFFVEAGIKYGNVFTKHPEHALAPQALYRFARIYDKKLKLYPQAATFYSKLIDVYPASKPWTAMAKTGLFNCPSYFPLNDKNLWVEGDSQTGGKNMRAEWICKTVSTGTYSVTKRVYAGKNFVSKSVRYYEIRDFELREYSKLNGSKYETVLSYPFSEGRSWEGGDSVYRIVASDTAVNVKAGKFDNCIKVRVESRSVKGSLKYNYYAPQVGWVLTTTSVAGGVEHRNTELLSCKIMPEK